MAKRSSKKKAVVARVLTGTTPTTTTVAGSSTVTVSFVETPSIVVSLQTPKPVVSFVGEWRTKDVKLILRAIPRAYHLFQSNRRKENPARKSE